MKQQFLAGLAADIEFFNRSTSALTEDDSDFAPAAGTYTVAQQVAHAAQTIDWFVEGAFRPEGFVLDFEAMEAKVLAVTSLADARAWLARAVENARRQIESTPDEDWGQPLPDGPIHGGQPRAVIFGSITDHTAHHRGALTVYARLRGKTPPMPYMDPPDPA